MNCGKFCSRPCMWKYWHLHNQGIKISKICPVCKKEFFVSPSQTKKTYCSKGCSYKRVRSGARWAKYYTECQECHTTGHPHGGHGYCKKCWPHTPEGKEWQRIKNQRKPHRRTHLQNVDISASFLKKLWSDTNICSLCGEMMAEHTNYPEGRHLDHIVPVWVNGKHEQNNVRYVHAKCNVNREENWNKELALQTPQNPNFCQKILSTS